MLWVEASVTFNFEILKENGSKIICSLINYSQQTFAYQSFCNHNSTLVIINIKVIRWNNSENYKIFVPKILVLQQTVLPVTTF